LVNKIEREWNMLTVQDVVWNHAAKNARWLMEHPECGYSCSNSPHLRPAYVVDRVYHHFGKEVGEGKWASRGVPNVVDSVHHTNAIEYILRTEVLPKINLHEFFQVDIEQLVQKFEELAKEGASSDPLDEYLPITHDPEWRRFGSSVDWSKAMRIFNRSRLALFSYLISSSQLSYSRVISTDLFLASATEPFRIRNAVTFQDGCFIRRRPHREVLRRIQESPRAFEWRRCEMLFFAFLQATIRRVLFSAGKEAWEILMTGLRAIMGHITYQRIADHGPKFGAVTPRHPLTTDYFLHTENTGSWEEEEKLAYDPDKSRFLLAFNGWVMCDNPLKNFALPDSQVYLRRELVCWGDSVKLNYGEKPEDCPYLWQYMKDYTQKCAKMFHGLRIDNAHGTPIHVAEYLLLAAREIRPDIYVFAELFTGSEDKDNLFVNRLGISSLIRGTTLAKKFSSEKRKPPTTATNRDVSYTGLYGGDVVGAMIQKPVRLAPVSVAHGLFLDQSHDNPTPIETRSVYDLLPTAAMVSMAACAVGSTRGYDELVRHKIHVVSEKRPYAKWGCETNDRSGIIEARRVLNELHLSLARANYTQAGLGVFVDQMSPDVVGITRHNPVTHDTVVVVAHTAFNKNNINKDRVYLKHIPIGGVLQEVLFEMRMDEKSSEADPEREDVLAGLSKYMANVHQHIPPGKASMCTLHGGVTGHIELTNFPSGSVIGFRIRLSDTARTSIRTIRGVISGNAELEQELAFVLNSVSLQDFNRLLFTCDAEEWASIGQGAYNVPRFGKLVYCGLQGLIPVLDRIRVNNDLGHPLCANLRDGTWLCDYIAGRLEKYPGLTILSQFFQAILAFLKDVPYYLRPCYFEALISYLYKQCRLSLMHKMSRAISTYSSLVRSLALSSVSFVGHVPGAGLAPLPPSLKVEDDHPSSISAGKRLETYWQNIIISYAGSLRHGLIPNLLAEGKGARYNCRDAVWFWLHSIERYVKEAPSGQDILKCKVRRIYPQDDTIFDEDEREDLLMDVMYEALQRHFSGIEFRERNAGQQIDEHMRDEGFNVKAYVNRDTGFIHGGNRWNCGTWMDKMGSSEKAGNRGEPATPRDGAAVELQALAYSVLSTMAEWFAAGIIDKDGVSSDDVSWTWSQWAETIKANFERHFFVDENHDGKYVNRRNILKDTVDSSLGYTDYQLRCNFTIALATAPTLLDPHKAWMALDMAKEHLLGPLGIKTLDPSDWAYNGDYNNDDDSTNKKTAKGWNYHQGPEWVWVAGFYLRARLAVGHLLGGAEWEAAKKEVQSRLGNYFRHIKDSSWSSLPELTNSNGRTCGGSCPAQAWSVGCVLEACRDFVGLAGSTSSH
uniref:Amylo-alpha-1,6-glucosidase n=1 Tax=Heligmosomoides polygyrus TaxID=6339 RepID=A0A8L8K969_HELPZ